MVRDGEYVAIFNSVHRVMKAEKLLKGLSLPILLIPAPRTLVSECGLAIRYDESSRNEVVRALAVSVLIPDSVYRKCADGYVVVEENFLP